MRRSILLLPLAVLSSLAAADSSSDAAMATVRRVFPTIARHFHFKAAPVSARPNYTYRATMEGEVYIEGPTAVAMCRGAYDYLRSSVGAEVSWSGTTLGKGKLRGAFLTRVESNYRSIQLDSNGVPGVFGNWDEWERHLDVMALHGISVLGSVTKPRTSLPESYRAKSVALQAQVLARMTELGIRSTPQSSQSNSTDLVISSAESEFRFELLCETAWHSGPVDLQPYLPDMVRNRYGESNPDATEGWQKLVKSIESAPAGKFLLQSRPHDLTRASRGDVHDSALFRSGVADLLRAQKAVGANPLYQADVIRFAAQLALIEADAQLLDAALATGDGQTAIAKKAIKQFETLVRDADQLLDCHPVDRLRRYTDNARAWGTTPVEAATYEAAARRQVADIVKTWSGMIASYYGARWINWLANKNWDIAAFDEQWINAPMPKQPAKLINPIKTATILVNSILDSRDRHYSERLKQ